MGFFITPYSFPASHAPFFLQEPIRSLGGEVLIKSNAKVVVVVEFFPMALDLLKLEILFKCAFIIWKPKQP